MRARTLALLLAGTCLGTAALIGDARAQNSNWQAGGVNNTDYSEPTNWDNNTPPTATGQTATFGSNTLGGSTTVDLTAAVGPTSWVFTPDAQSYTVQTSNASQVIFFGPGGGIVNNANATQTIAIQVDVTEFLGTAKVQQNGDSTLILSGTNSYSGGTEIKAGTVQVTNDNALGLTSSVVTFDGGRLQADGNSNLNFFNDMVVKAGGGTIDNNGIQLVLGGNITDGTGASAELKFTGNFSGLTILGGTNTFSGGMRIIETNVRLESAASAGTGAIAIDGGTLLAGADMTLTNNIKLVANVSNLANVIDNNGYQLTISGVISDASPGVAGKVEFADGSGGFPGGKTILTAANTYTGGTLICFCTTVDLGTASQAGSIIGEVENLGTLNVVNSDTSGITKIKNDGGTLNFLNATNASSILIDNINGASLTFSDSSSAKNATINNDQSLMTFEGNAKGGSATINNTNAFLRFIDNSNAENAKINIDAGSGAQFENNAKAGSAIIDSNGGLLFADNSSAENATIKTRSGAITLFFNNANGGNARFETDAGGQVDFSSSTGPGGSQRITAGSIAGDGEYFIGSGNTLVVGSNNESTKVGGVIADQCGCQPVVPGGTLEKVGTGTLILSGTNIYTGGTIITQGVLQLGDGGTTGSILGDVLNNATLAFNRSDAVSFTGLISGTGNVVHDGTGTTTLTQANTYSGGTIVNAGTLKLGVAQAAGATTGSLTVNGGTFDLAGFNQTVGDFSGAGNVSFGSATFTAGASNNTTFAGVMSGTGAFVKQGSGALNLTGTSTYTGATTVNAGTLYVNGSIASSSGLTSAAGTIIGGNGTLPTTTIGGTLSPGNSIGTINVKGNLTFAANSTYAVELSTTTADLTKVTGSAQLAGTVAATFAPGTYSPKTYTILTTTGGLNGTTFSGLTGTVPTTFKQTLSYTSTDVLLTLALDIAKKPDLNQNTNQSGVTNTVQNGLNNNPNAPAVFTTLINLPTPSFSSTLTQLSGEIGTGAATAAFQNTNQFLNVMLDPFLETRLADGTTIGRAIGFAPERQSQLPDVISAYVGLPTKAPPATFAQRWTVWGTGYGGSGRYNGDASTGSRNLTASSGNFAAGVDYRISPDTVLGMAISGGALSFGLDGTSASGKGDVVQVGAYASTRRGNAYLSGAVAYGRYDLSTERSVIAPGIFDRLGADFIGNTYSGRLEGGYRFVLSDMLGVTPFAAVQVQRFDTGSYTERDLTGQNAFALNYFGRNWTDTRSELGARADYRMWLDSGVLTLRGRAAWGHNFSNDRTVDTAFVALPGFAFSNIGASPARDVALVSAGAEMKFRNGVALRAKFDGEFSGRTQVYAGSGGLYVSW